MKLAIVTADWPAITGGGVAAITATLADGLHAAGHDVAVWTRGGGRRRADLQNEIRPYPVVGLPGRSWRSRGAAHWRRELPARMDGFAPDAVIASTWDPLPGGADALVVRGRCLRVFAHGRDITGDPGADRVRSRATVLGAGHRWFCLTRWMVGQLTSQGIDPSRVVRVPAAVPPAPGTWSPEPGRILAVGRLVPRKGQDVLIGAMTRLPNARLDIVGRGPDRARLDALVTDRGLADRVTLHGGLPDERLEALWRRAA